ncbi:MAG: type II toxin-antitoxin system VapC family toxin [Deltaproteobacteria bacterium]|nr:type II toxin-antitoxin system VapC family toxin [Deltaproteobacteria bacterium]
MSGRVLLDTNIIIAMFAGEPTVTSRLKDCAAVFIPSVVLGELYYAAFKSGRVDENTSRVDGLAACGDVVECDAETARMYGQVKNELRARGRPIPENDIWIAAMARRHQLAVVTRDGHFDEVEGLIVEHW